MPSLLEKYIKIVEAEKEVKRVKLLRETLGALNTLSKEIPFQKAYVFGSIMKKKKFYYDSDIDIAVIGLKDKDFFHLMARASDILGRDVDVIQLEGHRLRSKIIKEGLLWKKQN